MFWVGRAFALNELPAIPACPHQPADFDFPKSPFEKTMRSCQASWFKQFKFLHYDEARDLLFCHICVSGFRQKKLKGSNADPAFVSVSTYYTSNATESCETLCYSFLMVATFAANGWQCLLFGFRYQRVSLIGKMQHLFSKNTKGASVTAKLLK